MESSRNPVDALGEAFWFSDLFRRVQTAFWVAFVAVPVFTGLLAYRWLPNESYDAGKHELLESHDVETDDGRVGQVADVWRDKETGRIFTRADFEQHNRREARRMAGAWFAYGLVGCSFYAFVQWVQKRSSFRKAFGIALLVDVAAALLAWGWVSG